ncbi:NrdR family transcriptional regulator [Bacillus massiliigorillae]|uniref:NrdR family transcriptional regulator n=1 Tax=Bacillus massiliigorillae TaxID=1243664 RepID=UPI0003A7AEC0|nr:hypothetical protein [Bacillus massiliigorillae]
MMKCPICGGKTRVIKKKPGKNGSNRARECVECLTRFTSYETLVITSLDPYLQNKYFERCNK